jgi:ParB/RepB/Spo0J family partition protein
MVIVHPSRITDNPFQVRSAYGDVEELADRIEAKYDAFPLTRGLMQVPLGRLVYEDGTVLDRDVLAGALARIGEEGMPVGLRVQLAFGHRRLRAFRYLCDRDPRRYEGMPVQIVDLTDEQMLDAVWSENRERSDISAVEEAELLQRKLARVQAEGGSQREVAEAWGISRPTVANRLRLLELPQELQAANRAGTLSERQLLALAPVVKLVQLTHGVPWNETPNDWAGARSPEWFIEHVLANPETPSDDIREYVKSALKWAGEEVPDVVAEMELGVAGTVQPTCQGCPMRMNQFCLNHTCFNRKVIAFGDQAAQLLSEELGVPPGLYVSPATSKQPAYAYRDRLQMLVEAGMTDNLGLAWTTDFGVHAAPDRDWQSNRFQANGRHGVVYFHSAGWVSDEEYEAARRVVAAAVAEGSETAVGEERGPGHLVLNAWHEQERLLCDGLRDELYRQLSERTSNLAGSFGELQPLLATLMHMSFDKFLAIGDPAETLAAIVDHAWGNAYIKHDSADKLAERAERMGICWDDEVVALASLLDALYDFYRDSWGNKRVAERLLQANERWLSPEFDGGALGLLPDMGKSLDGWLARAVAEARALLERVEEVDGE